MAHNDLDLDDLGRSIQDVIDRAVNSKDYQKLEQTVRNVVGRAVNAGSGVVRKVVDTTTVSSHTGRQNVRRLYGSTVGKAIGSVAKAMVGFPTTFFSALALFFGRNVETQVAFITDPSMAGVLLAFLALGTWLSVSGVRMLNMIKRFKAYCRTLGQKTHCSLEKLAWSVNKSRKFVRQDLRRMTAAGLFKEGHLDREETCFITSHETFQLFEQSRLELEQRQQLEAASRAEETPSGTDPQVQAVLDKGDAFIAQIRKCNDDIPGEEVSAKIYRMEMVLRRIFQRVKTNPEVVTDLKKLMDYYLPMTVKLLNTYADMDAQPVQGETIQSSKREIEATLDTLILAFEKLLDDLFADAAMDVSSDISVLNTLLAQEGLKEDGFSKAKEPRNS